MTEELLPEPVARVRLPLSGPLRFRLLQTVEPLIERFEPCVWWKLRDLPGFVLCHASPLCVAPAESQGPSQGRETWRKATPPRRRPFMNGAADSQPQRYGCTLRYHEAGIDGAWRTRPDSSCAPCRTRSCAPRPRSTSAMFGRRKRQPCPHSTRASTRMPRKRWPKPRRTRAKISSSHAAEARLQPARLFDAVDDRGPDAAIALAAKRARQLRRRSAPQYQLTARFFGIAP